MKKSTLFKVMAIIAFSTIVFFACKKGDDKDAAVITDAVIYDSGSIVVDGCGWIIKVPVTDSTYSPINLADQ